MLVKLSIVIVFCDKDYHFIEPLISKINNCIKVNKEIILIDNRDKYKDEFIKIEPNCKIYSKGYNCYQFTARKFAIQFCTGNYVWFIDADDDVRTVSDRDILNYEDILVFDYSINQKKSNKELYVNVHKLVKTKMWLNDDYWVFSKNITDPTIFGAALWNKWIRTDILKKYAETVTEEHNITAGEDVFLLSWIWENSEKVAIQRKSIYLYNIVDSRCHLENISKSVLEHLIQGDDDINKLSLKYLKNIGASPFFDIVYRIERVVMLGNYEYFINKMNITYEKILECLPAIFDWGRQRKDFNKRRKHIVNFRNFVQKKLNKEKPLKKDFLSIILIAYNYSKEEIQNKLEVIDKIVNVDKEVIIVNENECKTILQAVLKCKNNYVWFVSMNDYIYNIPNSIDTLTEDFVSFFYQEKTRKPITVNDEKMNHIENVPIAKPVDKEVVIKDERVLPYQSFFVKKNIIQNYIKEHNFAFNAYSYKVVKHLQELSSSFAISNIALCERKNKFQFIVNADESFDTQPTEELFLSIIILMIDRDCETITNLIKDIHKKVALSHEIIIVDNREKCKDLYIDFLDARVISKGRNLYQFESKRYASLFAKGKYIWFVDSDDFIYNVNCNTEIVSKYDFISFSFYGKPLDYSATSSLYKVLNTYNISSETMIKEITVNTWNKWFKTEVFQTIAKELPEDNEIVAMEDEFWNRIFLRRVNKLLIMNTAFYDHKPVGLTCSYIFSLEKAKLLLKGFEEMSKIFIKFLGEKTLIISKKNAIKYIKYNISLRNKVEQNLVDDYLKNLLS